MVFVTLFCVLAVYIPFSQGNDQDGIQGKHLQESNLIFEMTLNGPNLNPL